VTQAATHDARLSILAARCGTMMSGIAGVSSGGISEAADMDPRLCPDKLERRHE
jgi:hypothetical protein